MAIRKGNVSLQVSVPKEIKESMDAIVKSISEKNKRPYTKGNLISDIYLQWLEFQGREIEAFVQEETKEEKKDA